MVIDILTLFPSMFSGPFSESILKKAIEKGIIEINIHNLRDWASDKHRTVDDRSFGGGPGMIIRVDVVDRALKELKLKIKKKSKLKVILLSPQGEVYSQINAVKMAKYDHVILIAGHYEGFDERIKKYLVDEEISIGDYILTGGEIPAMVIIDSVVRLLPGVLDSKVTQRESFSFVGNGKLKKEKLLDYPQYTKPVIYNDWGVPEVLLSGNHKEIEKWRGKKALENTKKLRPDLLR